MPQFVALRPSLGSSTASGGRHRDRPQALHRSALRPLKDHPDRPQKMGPTSLPTPLSPMRGLARRQGLGIRCLPVRAVRRQALPVLSPALAPASGSALMLTRLSAPGRETLASFPGRPSTGGSAISPSVHGRNLEGMSCRSGPKTFSCNIASASDRVGPIHERRAFAFHHRPSCFGPKSAARWSQECMDSTFHVFPVRNFSVIRGCYASNPVEVPRRSDNLKLPLTTRFVQRTRHEFSTFSAFRCGGGWISPPSVAEI
jgi:hypothetical protein